MAISLKTAGAWARMVTDNGTVAIPGVPAAGDRMFLFGSWKTFTVTVVTPNGWNLISDFSDGAIAAGNATGSVHNAVYYRDWVSGDTAPAIDYSAAPTEGHWVIMLWTKAGGDVWNAPRARTGAIAAADPFSVNASATIDALNSSVIMGLVGLRDDSTTIARNTDALDDTGLLITWTGNWTESPATHFSSTTGLDMSGDLGHRFVTTGASAVTLHMDGDPAAAETGAATFILQELAVPQLVTPGVAVLTTTLFAPAVGLGVLITPGTAALVTGLFAPTVLTPRLVTPGVLSLVTTQFAPSVLTPRLVTPGLATLVTATFVPTVLAPRLVTPGVLSLITTTFVPTISTPRLVTPGVLVLTTTLFEPTVTGGGGGEPGYSGLCAHAVRYSVKIRSKEHRGGGAWVTSDIRYDRIVCGCGEGMSTEYDLGYAAGAIDGEGCITLAYSNGPGGPPSAAVTVSNTDRRMPEWFRSRFGGWVYVRRQMDARWAVCWTWRTQGSKATAFLRWVAPGLVLKQRQAAVAIELQEVKRTATRIRAPKDRGRCGGATPFSADTRWELNVLCGLLRRLNRRGPEE